MPLVIVAVIGFLLWQVWPLILAVIILVSTYYLTRGLSNYQEHKQIIQRAKLDSVRQRADEQHQQITEGDWMSGTYGRYLPPEELRNIGYLRDLDGENDETR